jgi:hypothetical protein
MPFVQRNTAGEVIGCYANAQPGCAEEWLSDENPDMLGIKRMNQVAEERIWRNHQLSGLVWLRDRHRDQLEIGANTALSSEQFGELLIHMQALREWPQSEIFPDAAGRPQSPQFLEQFGGEQ